MDESPPVNRNVLALLLSVSILHLVFAITILTIHRVNTLREIPFHFMVDGFLAISFLGQVLVLGVLIYIGLYLGKRVGLGAPLIGSWARGEPVREQAMSVLGLSLAIGLGVAAAKYFLDLLIFSRFVPATLSQWRQVPLLFRLPIPFPQGIVDEISLRLFWMTVFVWIIWKIRGSEDTPLPDPAYWAVILLVGLFPVAGTVLGGSSGPVILQYAVLILAGVIPFGWLYWKRGIESALIAHFSSGVALVLLSLG